MEARWGQRKTRVNDVNRRKAERHHDGDDSGPG